jgi:hypothetical protein
VLGVRIRINEYRTVFEVGKADGTLMKRGGVEVAQVDRVSGSTPWRAAVEFSQVDKILRHAYEGCHCSVHTSAAMSLSTSVASCVNRSSYASSVVVVVGAVEPGLPSRTARSRREVHPRASDACLGS